MSIMQDIAREYLAAGYAPIPVPYRSKQPVIEGWNVLDVAEQDVERYFGQRTNIGIRLGDASGGLVDIDLDCGEAIAIAPSSLPGTRTFGRPGKRRSHWIYRAVPCPDKWTTYKDPTKAEGEPGAMLVELRTDGCQTIFPPSVHESGEPIAWENDGPVWQVDGDELREAVAKLAAASLLARHWPGEGARHVAALALAGGLLRLGWAQPIVEAYVEAIASTAGDVEIADRKRCVATSANRIRDGKEAWGWPRLAEVMPESVVSCVQRWLRGAPTGADDSEGLPDAIDPQTDLANGHRLALQHGADLRHATALGWLAWDGCRFAPDADRAAERAVHDVSRSVMRRAALLMMRAADAPTEGEQKALMLRAASLQSWARQSQQSQRIAACLTVAESIAPIVASHDAFDCDAEILNVRNGTIELRSTFQLRPHSRDDGCTKVAPVEYHADARCPAWLAFLRRIFDGNDQLIRFVQRAIGYSLTGLSTEQCFFLLWGTGANGKSTLLNVVRRILGDYGQATPTDTLMEARDRAPSNDVARLRGARLVTASESGQGRRLNEERIKALTGCEPYPARFLYREYFEFVPQFKLWLSCNNRPEVRGTDFAIWRRVMLIPFGVTIPKAEQDTALETKLAAESQGILAWAVEGCREWRRRGLDAPHEVADATASYRAEQDIVSRWIDEACHVHERMSCAAGMLHGRFASWCRDQGEEPVSGRAFGERLAADGRFHRDKTRTGWQWHGIGLQTEQSEVPDYRSCDGS